MKYSWDMHRVCCSREQPVPASFIEVGQGFNGISASTVGPGSELMNLIYMCPLQWRRRRLCLRPSTPLGVFINFRREKTSNCSSPKRSPRAIWPCHRIFHFFHHSVPHQASRCDIWKSYLYMSVSSPDRMDVWILKYSCVQKVGLVDRFVESLYLQNGLIYLTEFPFSFHLT